MEKRFIKFPGENHLIGKTDLFMVRYGEAGRVAIGFEGVIANNMFRLLPQRKISSKFMFYYLDYNFKRIHALGGSSTMPALKFSSISSFKILIPQIEEQKRRASILSNSDKEIELLKQKLVKLQDQKRGLMQQLLTGAVRVKI